MYLYDIHTHNEKIYLDEVDSYKQIINIYPEQYDEVYTDQLFFSCGIHPWYSENVEKQLDALSGLALQKRVVAIGEIGYDKMKGKELNVQQHIFELQAEIAESVEKPVVIHCVKAWDWLLMSKKRIEPKQPWVIHGYRGNYQLAEQLLSKGFYFSLGYHFNEAVVHKIPENRLLLETDTLDISVKAVYEKMSNILNVPLDVLTKRIEKNAETVFPLLSIM